MNRVGEHPVPAGPLAVRWLGWKLLQPARAGALTEVDVELENAGSAPWRKIEVSYHWLDDRGNPIVWGEIWAPITRTVEPGGTSRQRLEVRAPLRTGPHRLALDLVDEGRYWFSEVGNTRLEVDVDVEPRVERRLAVVFTPGPPELEAREQAGARGAGGAAGGARRGERARPPRAGLSPGARLVAPRARRAPAGLRGRCRIDRAARLAEAEDARAVGARHRPHPELRRIHSSARRSSTAASRGAGRTTSKGCPRSSIRSASRGSTTVGSRSQLDCDPVVDAPEHERAERERNDRRDDEVDDVRRASAPDRPTADRGSPRSAA